MMKKLVFVIQLIFLYSGLAIEKYQLNYKN